METGLCVYVSVVLEGMYTCKTGNFGNEPLCLCLCCCIGYVHIGTGNFGNKNFLFMFVFLYTVCEHVRLEILVTSLCVYCLCCYIGYVKM